MQTATLHYFNKVTEKCTICDTISMPGSTPPEAAWEVCWQPC